jgi:ATP-dependent DNA ligase
MNPRERDPRSLKRLLGPAAADLLAVRLAPPLVNSVMNEGPELLEDLSLFGEERSASVKTTAGVVESMLALAVTKLQEGPAWTYELRFDGYRALGMNANGRVQLLARNGKDFTNASLRSHMRWRRSLTIP